MSPLTDEEQAERQAHRLRLRLTLLRSSLSNLRSELTMERELMRLEKIAASATEPQRTAQTYEVDERSQLALQRRQSAMWFGQRLSEVDRQCSQVMDKVQRHMEPLRTMMSSLDTFSGEPCLDSCGSDPSLMQIEEWDADCAYPQRVQDVYGSGVWGQDDRDVDGCCRGRCHEVDNHSKNWRMEEMWKRGESPNRARGPNDWLDDEVSLRGRFAPCDDHEGYNLLSRNSSNSLWAQYD